MEKFIKSFDIRWSDLDPNRHVGNIAYMNFMNDTRMSFFASNGYNQKTLNELQLGPVVLSESFFYLKELMGDQRVYTDLELGGNTMDYKILKIHHCLYNHKGVLAAFSEILFGWLDLKTRKLIVPEGDFLDLLDEMTRSEQYKILTPEEIKLPQRVPKGRFLEVIPTS